jgi:hypothetical protein
MTAGASAGDLPDLLCCCYLFYLLPVCLSWIPPTAWSCAKPIIGLSLILCAKYFIKPHHDLAIGCLGAHHWYGRTDSGFCEHAGFKQPFFGFFASLDFGYLGYIIVGLLILAWGISIGVWKFGHLA